MAESGTEGLKILREEKIDLIICDQRMPEMNGFETLKIAKEEFPDAIRIMLSGNDFSEDIKTKVPGDISHFVEKPWKTEKLLKLLKTLLSEKNNSE